MRGELLTEDLVDAVKKQAVPAVPTTPAAAPGAPAPAVPEVKPNRFMVFLKRQWDKLTTETKKKPVDYTGRRLARIVNEELDGRGNTNGPAHRSTLGESVALATEHMIHGGDATTPGGFLVASGLEYAWIMWDEEPLRKQQADQPQGVLPPAGAQLAPPPPPQPKVLQPVDESKKRKGGKK